MSILNKNTKGENIDLEAEGHLPSPSYGKIEEDYEMEIDLLDLMYVLLDRIHYIIFFFLAGALLFNMYSYFCIHPTYQSTAKMYVVSASGDSVVDLSDINIGTSLTSDYEELMLSYPVLEQVIARLGLSVNENTLKNMISVQNPADTRILNVTVTSTDPKLARNIANALINVSIKYLPETMSTDPPNIAQKAKLPEGKVAPSHFKYTMIGGLLGAFLFCAYTIVIYLMDDTIHTQEDMEQYFGLVPLSAIPESEELSRDKQEKQKHAAKRRIPKLWKR